MVPYALIHLPVQAGALYTISRYDIMAKYNSIFIIFISLALNSVLACVHSPRQDNQRLNSNTRDSYSLEQKSLEEIIAYSEQKISEVDPNAIIDDGYSIPYSEPFTFLRRSLVDAPGVFLYLPGVKKISATTARTISSFNGNYIIMDDLEELDAEAAVYLAGFEGALLSLNGVRSIEPSTARHLAKFNENRHYGPFVILSLNGLSSINKDIARELVAFSSKHELGKRKLNASILRLNGLKEIDGETAFGLSKFNGFLHLGGLSTLDLNAAMQLSTFKEDYFLARGYQVDEIEKFKIRSKYKRWGLMLDGITSLQPEIAGQLAKVKGVLSLNGVEMLDPYTVKAFVGSGVYGLLLDGLRTIDRESIAHFKQSGISWGSMKGITWIDPGLVLDIPSPLNNLRNMDVELARALSVFPGKDLYLNGLTKIDPESASHLVQFYRRANDSHMGWEASLHLDGVTAIDLETASILSSFEGRELRLNGLKELDTTIARELGQFKGGFLYLNGLQKLEPEAALELGKFKGCALFLDGLRVISPAVAKGLAKFDYGHDYDNIGCAYVPEDYQAPFGPAPIIRGSVQGVKTSLSLNGLRRIDVSVARALASFGGATLYLDGIISLEVKQARALASFRGEELHLNGVSEIDEQSAGALALFAKRNPFQHLIVASQKYRERNNRPPKSINDLSSVLDKAALRDPWGNLYQLYAEDCTRPGVDMHRCVEFFSYGLDGVSNTADDVASWQLTETVQISLDGIHRMDRQTAEILTGVQWGISLNGLKDIDDETIAVLVGRTRLTRIFPYKYFLNSVIFRHLPFDKKFAGDNRFTEFINAEKKRFRGFYDAGVFANENFIADYRLDIESSRGIITRFSQRNLEQNTAGLLPVFSQKSTPSEERVTVSGEFKYSGNQAGIKRIEIFKISGSPVEELLHVIYVDTPGLFQFEVQKNIGALRVVGFIDLMSNGPSPDDPSGVINVTVKEDNVSDVRLNVVDGEPGSFPNDPMVPSTGSGGSPPAGSGGSPPAGPGGSPPAGPGY